MVMNFFGNVNNLPDMERKMGWRRPKIGLDFQFTLSPLARK